jgi:hypothetical protein
MLWLQIDYLNSLIAHSREWRAVQPGSIPGKSKICVSTVLCPHRLCGPPNLLYLRFFP